MNTHFLHLRKALPTLLLVAAAAACQAGSIQLTPVRVNLSNAAKVAVLTAHNTGSEESVMQVTLNKWTLEGQTYAYQQSQELVVTPVTFRLAAGAQQIVRIGLTDNAPAEREGAYRLLVEEVPPPASTTVTGTRMVIRHDLPVFVTPLQASKAALDVSVQCNAKGAALKLTNIGNVHMQLRSVAVINPTANDVLWHAENFDYLLPDAQRSWELALKSLPATAKNVLVTTLTDQGTFTTDVKNNCS
jgi:fimbrial chaperone protein